MGMDRTGSGRIGFFLGQFGQMAVLVTRQSGKCGGKQDCGRRVWKGKEVQS